MLPFFNQGSVAGVIHPQISNLAATWIEHHKVEDRRMIRTCSYSNMPCFLWFHYNNSRTVDHCDFKQPTIPKRKHLISQIGPHPTAKILNSEGYHSPQKKITLPTIAPSFHWNMTLMMGNHFFDWLPWNYGRKATKIPREAHLCAHNDVSWVGFQNTASSKLQCFKPLSKAS